MSPSLLILLQAIQRQIRVDVASDNHGGRRAGRLTHVGDFYRPAEILHRQGRLLHPRAEAAQERAAYRAKMERDRLHGDADPVVVEREERRDANHNDNRDADRDVTVAHRGATVGF